MGAQDNSKKGQRNSCLYTNKKTNILQIYNKGFE